MLLNCALVFDRMARLTLGLDKRYVRHGVLIRRGVGLLHQTTALLPEGGGGTGGLCPAIYQESGSPHAHPPHKALQGRARWHAWLSALLQRFCCCLRLPEIEGSSMNTDFKWRYYRGEVILWAVRWYCRYGISYRDLEEMLCERGVNVDHTTI